MVFAKQDKLARYSSRFDYIVLSCSNRSMAGEMK